MAGETHKDSGHRNGFSILFPLSRNLGITNASTPGYGVRPRLNTSQHVTPNDHWKMARKGNGKQMKQERKQWRADEVTVNVLIVWPAIPYFLAAPGGWARKSKKPHLTDEHPVSLICVVQWPDVGQMMSKEWSCHLCLNPFYNIWQHVLEISTTVTKDRHCQHTLCHVIALLLVQNWYLTAD